ncbi:hypothetical protein B0H13DRAFT_1852504 [Mycena leptocephala]|nr:hypothetical protein B0H13DRAFT_1852504 [Mycena leptocephala]
MSAWQRAKGRILKHAMGCAYLATLENGTLVELVIKELAKTDAGLLTRLNTNLSIPSKRTRDALEQEQGSSLPIEAPPLKRVRVSASASSSSQTPAASPAVLDPSGSQQNPMAKYRTEGKKALMLKANDAQIELFVCCGISPRIIGTTSLNTSLVGRTTFEDTLIPAYAANVRIAVIDYVKTCWFLTISFDGSKLIKKKFISVTITTVHRQSFVVDLEDVSRVSQTGDYFAELLRKWILKIGPNRICATASDNAGPTNKGRALAVDEFPRLLDFADACHNLHNGCKDICNIPAVAPVIAELKELLAFMSLSSYSQDWLRTSHLSHLAAFFVVRKRMAFDPKGSGSDGYIESARVPSEHMQVVTLPIASYSVMAVQFLPEIVV